MLLRFNNTNNLPYSYFETQKPGFALCAMHALNMYLPAMSVRNYEDSGFAIFQQNDDVFFCTGNCKRTNR